MKKSKPALKKKLLYNPKEFSFLLEKIVQNFSKTKTHKNKIQEQNCGIVGIHTRGVFLAQRISRLLKKKTGKAVPVGTLDITLYRDDIGEIGSQPLVKETEIPFPVEGKTILLVDDVLYTGRTIRAALDAILELGRPQKILLSVLIDRGGRELPVQPDFLGAQVSISPKQEVQVQVKELDKKDGVWIISK